MCAQNGAAPNGADPDLLQIPKLGQPPSSGAAALSDGFEDISLDDGAAKAADAKAGGKLRPADDGDKPPKAAQRIVLFSGALHALTVDEVSSHSTLSSARAAVSLSNINSMPRSACKAVRQE